MKMLSRRRAVQLVGGLILLNRRSIAATSPMDQSGFVHIGGIEQWIAIQGRDARNPAILFLHGGPSEAQSPFLKEFAPWEQDFTVVNWDQRGSGKTYGRNGPSTPGMTLDRMTDDAIEIAEHLRDRLSQRKIILVGQSWGSILGVNVIKRRPELFHAFVGTGQVVSLAAGLPSQLQWARRQASAADDQESLKALDEAAKSPASERIIAEVGAASKWLMSAQDLEYAKMVRDFTGSASEHPRNDAADWLAGAEFSGPKLLPEVLNTDLRKLGLNFSTPFFVFEGRDDHVTPFEVAEAYVKDMHALTKAFVPIDGGHFACFTNADQFVAALRKHVRPLAVQ